MLNKLWGILNAVSRPSMTYILILNISWLNWAWKKKYSVQRNSNDIHQLSAVRSLLLRFSGQWPIDEVIISAYLLYNAWAVTTAYYWFNIPRFQFDSINCTDFSYLKLNCRAYKKPLAGFLFEEIFTSRYIDFVNDWCAW